VGGRGVSKEGRRAQEIAGIEEEREKEGVKESVCERARYVEKKSVQKRGQTTETGFLFKVIVYGRAGRG